MSVLYKELHQALGAIERAEMSLPEALTHHAAAVLWAGLLHTQRTSPSPQILRALVRPRASLPLEGQRTQLAVLLASLHDLPLTPEWETWGLDAELFPKYRALALTRSPHDHPILPETLDALTPQEHGSSAFAILERALMHRDESLWTRGLGWMMACLRHGSLAPTQSTDLLRQMLHHETARAREASLEALASAWACAAWPMAHALPHLRDLTRTGAPGARRALFARADRDLVLLSLHPERASFEDHVHAIRHIGPYGRIEDIEPLLSLATQTPEVLGDLALEALLVMHHRGVFVRVKDLERTLEVFDRSVTFSPEHLTALLYTIRDELHERLVAIPPQDPRWRRRAELLPFLERGHALLTPLISTLPAAQALRLVRACANPEHEDLVWGYIESHTALALDALATLGGAPTVERLARALGLAASPASPALCTHQARALELLWHLDVEETWRHQLLLCISPEAIPPSIRSDLQGSLSPDAMELLALADEDPDQLVTHLCQHAGIKALPAIERTVRRCLMELGDLEHDPTSKGRVTEMTLSPQVAQEICSLGKRAARRGAFRPLCLQAEEPGHALLNHVLCRLLQTPLSSDATRAALAALRPLQTRAEVDVVLLFMRHANPHIRKMAIRALATASDPGPQTRIRAQLEARDAESCRAALEALEAAGAVWAAHDIAACLERPNLNLKILAARALRTCGITATVGRLMFWLGHHEHHGFRRHMVCALEFALGDMWATFVRAEAANESNPRRRGLLLAALPIEDPAPDPPALRLGSPADLWPLPESLAELSDVNLPDEHVRAHTAELLARCARDPEHTDDVAALIARAWSGRTTLERSVFACVVRDVPVFRLHSEAPRLKLLQAAGVPLGRSDVLAMLQDAAVAWEPARAQALILRDALGLKPCAPEPVALEALRRRFLHDDPDATSPRSRSQLVNLWDELPPEVWPHAIDWAREPQAPTPRTTPAHPRPLTLEELEAQLSSPEEPIRDGAALAASRLTWAPELLREVLRQHVHGMVTLPQVDAHALLVRFGPPDVESLEERVRVLASMRPSDVDANAVEWLWSWWERGTDEVATLAASLLQQAPLEALMPRVVESALRGEFGAVVLIRKPLVRSAWTDELTRALEPNWREVVAPWIVRGALWSQKERDERRMALERPAAPSDTPKGAGQEHRRAEAITALGSQEEEEVLGALRVLKHHRDEEVARAVLSVLDHERVRVRDAARRALKRVGTRRQYWEATLPCLSDTRSDTRRNALRVFGHARFAPALGKIVMLTLDRDPTVRRAAVEALLLFGEDGSRALEAGARRARPDQRRALEVVGQELKEREIERN